MSNYSILIIDDQDLELELMTQYISNNLENCCIEKTTNPIAGLEKAKTINPTLIITDWEMPSMSGIELIKLLKQNDVTVKIPVMICTGVNVAPKSLKTAFDAGAVDFIRKPWDGLELLARVKTQLELKTIQDKILRQNDQLNNEIELRKIAEENYREINVTLNELNKDLEKKINDEVDNRRRQEQLLVHKSKLESLGTLAAGIAHEINQPLTGISMGLENIQIKLNNQKLNDEYLNRKINSFFEDINRIKTIIEHVRIFSRDQSIILFDKINVNQIIKDALMLTQVQYQNHNINLIVELDDFNAYTLGNRYKLEQVFINLMSNAKQAIDEKFKYLENFTRKKEIKITSYIQNNWITVDFIDNGNGIPAENLKRIFDPFFTTKSAEKGTGIGLSISYGIIREMNGEITVESEENEYTKMSVKLPKFQ